MPVMNINKNNFQNEVMNADKPVLLDFWVMHYSIICKCKYIYENLGRKRKFIWNSYSTGSYY